MRAEGESLLFAHLAQRSAQVSPSRDRKKCLDLLDLLFPQQRSFIEDRSRFKSLLCPRRAGKSFVCAIYLIVTSLLKPSARSIFATLTQKTARQIIWGLLKQLDKTWELDASFHNTNMTMTFPNGSMISLAGAESRAEIDKFRGQAYDLFILDECKSFPPRVLDELIDQVVTPALSDYLGSLCLAGTPGNVLQGVFYAATHGNPGIKTRTVAGEDGEPMQLADWSFHAWKTKDNVKLPHIWKDQLLLKARKGWSDENPIWRREYLGEWVSNDDAFVYRYSRGVNTWERDEKSGNEWGLPSGHDWEYILGCDLGYDDPFAVTISAFSPTHPDMFMIDEFKQTHLIVADIARVLMDFRDKYGEFAAEVGDRGGLGKMVFEELATIYGIDLIAAEKQEKRDYIDLLNSDLVEGRIKILDESMLADEWSVLVWADEKRDKEDRSGHNHLADAFLYSWRYCQHHFFSDKRVTPEKNSAEYWKLQTQKDLQEAIERRRRARLQASDWETAETVEWDLPATVADVGDYW